MRLAAGQRARIAAKKGQMRCEFLAKRHMVTDSPFETLRLFERASRLMQPCKGRIGRDGHALPRIAVLVAGTKHRVFCFHWRGERLLRDCVAVIVGASCSAHWLRTAEVRCAQAVDCKTEARCYPREGGREVECVDDEGESHGAKVAAQGRRKTTAPDERKIESSAPATSAVRCARSTMTRCAKPCPTNFAICSGNSAELC